MPAEEITENVLEALRAVDSPTLARVADSTGLSERTLWRYRDGATRPTEARARTLARALGLSSHVARAAHADR